VRMDSRGFTLIETVIVLVVATVLIDVGYKTGSDVMDRLSVDSSRNVVAALHARARARAIEQGTTARLFLDPAGDSAWVTDASGLVDRVNFAEAGGIDIVSDDDAIVRMCMTARGIADTGCNSFNSAVTVAFVRGAASKDLTFRPLGQLTRPQ
jgi:prepilin-type N-terminal cleavage/methylation domain-containing protein